MLDKAQTKKETPAEKRSLLEKQRVDDEYRFKNLFQSTENMSELLVVDDWLKSLVRNNSMILFKKVGKAICDAIIIPECPVVFGEG